MISVKNVWKSYHIQGRTHTVLKDVSFELKAGRKLALLGRNGAGKSTLIRLIGKIEMPNRGSVHHGMSVSWPLGFGGAFQGSLTGIDNMRFLSRIYQTDFERMRAFVEDFAELGDFLYQPVKVYSSGMRARLAFALSIAIEFECYLIDEVILVGDQRFHDRCREHLFDHANNRSLILASHDGEFVKRVCDEAVLLTDGHAYHYTDVEEALHAYHETVSSRPLPLRRSVPLSVTPDPDETAAPATDTDSSPAAAEPSDSLAEIASLVKLVHSGPAASKASGAMSGEQNRPADIEPASAIGQPNDDVSPELFVSALYRHVLLREPDLPGFAFNVRRLKEHGFASELPSLLRDFMNSDEASALVRGRHNEAVDFGQHPPIQHIISLGTHCYTSFMLKRYGLKRYSGPFDWIFSSQQMVAHCIEDDFSTFLDPRHFEPVPLEHRTHADANRVEHIYYREKFGVRYVFNHHDVHQPEDFGYMSRCVDRFRQTLAAPTGKLFVQCSRFTDTSIAAFDDLCRIVDRRTENATILSFLISDSKSRAATPDLVLTSSVGNHRAFVIHPVSNWQPLDFEDPVDELLIMRTISRLKIQLEKAPG